ncbi:hypothetical protein [Methylocystis heyeri]|uniref:Uncharacterized protein n=1 Tax=Methylocystis heyeri TaxID=391905 RepID=A0A6B8KHS9_9HYPH|nr:hypothetical protein [Methylocystis heyeri]QGM46571.1 hypothetical protein H2LOC_013185 [Methylocystis heyeri]
MKLGLRRTHEEVVVFREKWGAFAFGLALGAACIAFAIGFYALGADRAPSLFIAPFCFVFLTAGLAVWRRLAETAKSWLAEDGAVVFRADAKGVEVAPWPGSASQRFPWPAISEVALADSLRTRHADETAYNRGALIVFFAAGEYACASWFDLARNGLARSAEGRVFQLASYPLQVSQELLEAVRKIAPADVVVKRYEAVVFDYVKRMDGYEEISLRRERSC